MKNRYSFIHLLFFLIIISTNTFGQTDCCVEVDRPEPGFEYLDALSLCFLADEIECFSMRGPSLNVPIAGCPIHQLDNPHTYIIFPIDDSFRLRIEPTNCSINDGIQVMLYRLISSQYVDSCKNLNPQLSNEQLFCDGSTNTIEFTQTNAKDEIFYLFVDGLNGDICDYTIESLSGSYRNAPRDSISLSGPTGLPIGYTATYTAEQFSFDCFEDYGCNCGVCGLDTFGIIWTGPPGAIVNPIPGTLSAEVTMGSQSGSVCIRLKDDCENLFRCIYVEVTQTEFYEKCPNDFVFAHGEIYGDAGIYYPIEGNYIYEVVVEEYVEDIVLEFIDGCIGQTFQDCVFNTISYPQTDNVCSILENDTCKTVQTFITWHPSLDTTIFDTICFGMTRSFCGNIYSTSGLYDCFSVSQYGCDSNTHLSLFVLPPDSLFITETICAGGELLFCGQDIDHAGVFSCSDTLNDGCIEFSILSVFLEEIDTMTIDTALCELDTFVFLGVNYPNSGTYVVEVTDLSGCLERYLINLLYDQSDTTFVFDTLCPMQVYDFCGMSITSPGVYYCSYETTLNCDSVVELTITPPPCGPSMVYSVLCPGDEVVLSDTVVRTDGVYINASRVVAGCACTDTFVFEYSDLGASEIIASNELSCENETVNLSIDFDDLFYTFHETNWFFNGQMISDNNSLSVTESGSYFVVIEYSHIFIETCIDTLFYELAANDEFNPSVTWIDRDLVVCDSNLTPYHLEFQTDAPYSTLTLLNTNEEWLNQTDINLDLPIGDGDISFRLTLQSENGACEEVVEFVVRRSSVDATWPDTAFISSVRTITSLVNPMFNLDPPAENISYVSTNFSNGIDGQNLIIDPVTTGPINLSFEVGDCIYNYSTVVVRNAIFVPTAFSPNNDGINDLFTCFTSRGFIVSEVKIFNRWGIQVFSKSTEPIAWNGRSNDKDMPEGVYVVQYSYLDQVGNVFNGVSELMLIR